MHGTLGSFQNTYGMQSDWENPLRPSIDFDVAFVLGSCEKSDTERGLSSSPLVLLSVFTWDYCRNSRHVLLADPVQV